MNFKKSMIRFIVGLTVLVIGVSGNSLAADWKFYGTASVNTFVTDSDLADSRTLGEELNPGACIGAEVQVSDSVSGGFEYGTEDGGANVVTLFGVWDFGPGSLMIGQNETVASLGISGQVFDDDRALRGMGEFNPEERTLISLTFGALEIAAVEPDTQVSTAAGLDDSLSEVRLPTLQARYTFAWDIFEAGVAGAYTAFDYNDQDVDAYAIVASAGLTINRVRVAAQGWFGRNAGNIAVQDTRGDEEDGFAVYEGGKVHDVDAWGAALAVQVIFNDMLSMEAGYGFVELDYNEAVLFGTDKDQVQAYYLNLPITLADGVQIVPEIGVMDYHETGQDEVTYYGAKWQIEF